MGDPKREACDRHPDREGYYGVVMHALFDTNWRQVVRPEQTFGPFCSECRSEFIAWACTRMNDAALIEEEPHEQG